jgi:hypothetical protein
MMSTRKLAASLIAVIAMATPMTASAADLYGEAPRYEDDDYGGRHESRGYGRDYGGGYDERYRYEERYDERRYGSAKDDGYLPPIERAPRFAEERHRDRYGYDCAPRWQVKNRLIADGWHNFERLAVRPNVVVLRAERPGGRAFVLKLDRCTGEVIAHRPARWRGYGAYGPGPRRYGWAY